MAVIIGTSSSEVLHNTPGADLINALDGNDTIFGSGYQNDTIDGGLGIDVVDYSSSGGINFNVLYPNSSNVTGTITYPESGYQDLLYSVEEIIAPSGGGMISAYALFNSYTASGSATASIDVNLSVNSLKIVDASISPVSITVVNFNSVVGTLGSDTIIGNSQVNLLDGRQGNDFLDGKEGNDTLYGSFDYDTLYGGSGNDWLDGGLADDFLYGNDGDDFLDGGGGSNFLDGGSGNDLLGGGEGNDTLHGGHGDDTVSGGEGNDFVEGGYGDDTLYGREGSDTLHGGEGDDWLNGGGGGDTLAGGKGNDIYFIYSIDDAISEYSTTPGETDVVYSDVSFNLGGNLENLFLTGYAARGIGNGLNNLIVGNLFANVIKGSGGDDTLDGGFSEGGGGFDTLQGGAGTDAFVLQKSIHTFDTILDFQANEKLLVSSSAFGGGLVSGVLDFTKLLIGSGFKDAMTGNQRFIFDTDQKSLYFDADGLGGLESIKIATFTGFSELDSSNFMIVA